MFSNKLYSPLRYPGGKQAFCPTLERLITENNLEKAEYYELYAGGSAVALHLLLEGFVSHIHINDNDPAIYSFWECATKRSTELLELIVERPISLDTWHLCRELIKSPDKHPTVEVAFATLFLNRTNRSGILNAGPIGGKSQDGPYKLDARFDKQKIAERIKRISAKAGQITVHCKDALALIEQKKEDWKSNTLVYLDPPYYHKGKGLYRNYYSHQDHLSIASILEEITEEVCWIVTYDDSSEIKEMYKRSQSSVNQLNYTAQLKRRAIEQVFVSKKLKPLS